MKRAKRINLFLFICASVLAVIYAFPFLLVLLNSVKEKREIINSPLAWPAEFKFDNFIAAMTRMGYWTALGNSLIVTIIAVSAIIVTSSMLAYYLARSKTKFSAVTFLILVASMIVPFQALMIPFVGLFGRNGFNLPFNQITISLFYVGFGVALSTFLYHGFISNIPYELDEAAAIDGASPFTTFRKVILPMLGPVTATVAIINGLWIWNDFLLPSIILSDTDQKTLPLRVFVFYGKYTSDYGLAMAGLVLSVVPILIFYFAMQRQIISGVSAGAVK